MNLRKKITGVLAAAGVIVSAAAQTPDQRIRLNTVGFLPNFPKTASIAVKTDRFDVVHVVSGNVVFSGAPDSVYNNDTREDLWIADFSELTQGGNYRVEVPGVGQSPTFRISEPVFKDTYRTMMLGMYLWRCGNPGGVSASYGGQTYRHGACHLNDGNMQYVGGGNVRRDAAGGWHDAGDYNKYVVNSGVSVGLMLKAWEHFWFALDTISLSPVTKSGEIPAYLAEVKWNLDWIAKMQLDNGWVSHKLTTLAFGGNIWPEAESSARFFMPHSSAATGAFVGMLAQAARLYRPYDPELADKWLAQARRGYNVLMASDTPVPADTVISKTGHYYSSGDLDKRLWAAAEMWETTGEARFLEYLESTVRNSHIEARTEWASIYNLACLTYVSSKRAGRDPELVSSLTNRIAIVADGILGNVSRHGYGRTFGTSYYWGTNGAVASTAYVLNAAYSTTGDIRYRHAVQDALSYLLGRNYFGRSFVTGVGYDPPKNPHCRRSTANGKPWPGYLIGGPHNDKPSDKKCSYPAICWDDDPTDYWTNEIAINWNTAMIYALASLLPDAGVYPAPPYPGQTVEEDVSVRGAARNKTHTPSHVKVSRIVRVRDGNVNIPHGAKVYSLDGRLVAERKHGAAAPRIRRNGVYIVHVETK